MGYHGEARAMLVPDYKDGNDHVFDSESDGDLWRTWGWNESPDQPVHPTRRQEPPFEVLLPLCEAWRSSPERARQSLAAARPADSFSWREEPSRIFLAAISASVVFISVHRVPSPA